jgi:hypothetical protein
MERHPMDPWSLSFGIAFVVAGLALSLIDIDFAHLRPSLWWPLPVLFTGLLVVLIALARTRARDDEAAGERD